MLPRVNSLDVILLSLELSTPGGVFNPRLLVTNPRLLNYIITTVSHIFLYIFYHREPTRFKPREAETPSASQLTGPRVKS